MKRIDHTHGILLVDKPAGLSSHDVVLKIRHSVKQQGVGHTGTLDPQAEGLLVLCLGRATKTARFLSDGDKTYEAEITLGLSSTTYDAEGLDPEARPKDVPMLTESEILGILREYVGTVVQKVPVYSAVKVEGKRLYKIARSGKTIETPERVVKIRRIDLLSYDAPRLRIRIECSKGTYIRTLAHNLGERIGCGGYLSHLRRTAIGCLRVENALTLSKAVQYATEDALFSHLLPVERALDFADITVSDEFSSAVANGPPLRREDVVAVGRSFSVGEQILLRNQRGEAIAIGTAGVDSGRLSQGENGQLFRYERVLN